MFCEGDVFWVYFCIGELGLIVLDVVFLFEDFEVVLFYVFVFVFVYGEVVGFVDGCGIEIFVVVGGDVI